MKGKIIMFLWGNLSLLLLLLAITNIFSCGIDDFTTQQSVIYNNGETSSSQINPMDKSIITIHNPIAIDGNEDFATQAISEGWSGNGSIIDPYKIINYYIGSTGVSGIKISNTNAHFIIENVTVIGSTNSFTAAFHFSNVTNGELTSNAASSSNNAFYLHLSSNNTLSDNIAANNSGNGFYLHSSSNNSIINNNIFNNSNGFFLDNSNNNTLFGNNVANNTYVGFILSYASSYNVINGNIAMNNSANGFELYFFSNYNVLNGNTVSNNSEAGFRIDQSSSYNVLIGNNITYNTKYGLDIHHTSSINNTVYLNTFIENNNGNCQAYSVADGQNFWSNGTHGNYWSDYTGIDSNGDGIGDTDYPIDGGAVESDPLPLMVPIGGIVIPEFSSPLLLVSFFFIFISLNSLVKKKIHK